MRILPPDAAWRLAAIVESSDDAIVSKDLDGIITSWNRGAERLFGYSADEAIGHSITMLIPPERVGEEEMVLDRIRRGDRVEHFDTVRRRKDGTFVDISLTVSPIRDAAGTIVGASKIARNISDRTSMEAELRDSHHRLMTLALASASIVGSPNVDQVLSSAIDLAREVFPSDGYAIWQWDETDFWRIVRSSGISDEFASKVVTEHCGQPLTSRFPFTAPLVSEDIATLPMSAAAREAYHRERIAALLVLPLFLHGERRGAMTFYSRRPRRYSDLDVQCATVIANLAAASLTTAELYEEQRKGREAADHARQEAAFLAKAGTALSGSLDFEATLKTVAHLSVPAIADWCAVDVVGERGALQRLAIAHADPSKIELARAIDERYPSDPATPGGVHEVIHTGRPVFVPRITPAMLTVVAVDEDHRRILTALNLRSYMCVPIMAHNRAFGAITFVSAESGREYSDSDLRFARELAARASLAAQNARSYARANEASRLKDEFLATLSHELRTPLNAVLGYARMLRTRSMPPEKTESAIEVVERNATALKQMIEDVLDVSRIVAGRLRLEARPVDLPAILKEASATVMPAADAKGVRVDMQIAPITGSVSGDPDRLRQIVWNLMSNAIKFTPHGGTVQLSLSRVDSHVEIVVSDTGRGISPDFLPFVFERFRQGDSSASREHGGLGLGLAIARQLAEMHGGTIAAASEGPGRGATFTVTLPLMSADRARAAAARADHHPSPEQRHPAIESVPRLDGIQVLAVDDEPDSLELLRAILENAGAKVATAASGPDALRAIRWAQPDVLVADIGMPGMDGLQLVRALRQMDEPLRSTPAAALTAYGRTQDQITSLASGFQTHLVKPVDPLELIAAVASLTSGR
jgi:PAS domain S-box-containing protein